MSWFQSLVYPLGRKVWNTLIDNPSKVYVILEEGCNNSPQGTGVAFTGRNKQECLRLLRKQSLVERLMCYNYQGHSYGLSPSIKVMNQERRESYRGMDHLVGHHFFPEQLFLGRVFPTSSHIPLVEVPLLRALTLLQFQLVHVFMGTV